MAKFYLIEKNGGGKWLSGQMGFVGNPTHALRFTAERDAQDHLANDFNLKDGGHRVVPLEIDEVSGRYGGQAQTDYNPFGFGRNG